MSFDTAAGTRGARQPSGWVLRQVNKLVSIGVRRRKPKSSGFNALVLTTIGAKTGLPRNNPVGYFPGPDGSWLIVASANGAVGNPAWYYNLAAHPGQAQIEIQGRKVQVTAEQLHGPPRAEAWQQITAAAPRFTGYQAKTDRELPVIRLNAKDGQG
jgi:deazaflavin-dependent oxidoreductase (nitroreductase family)